MLRNILSITGKPGLFRIVSSGSRMIVVEDVTTGKRMPAHQRDRIVSLGDISMYTDSGDLPLPTIMQRLYEAHEGKAVDMNGTDLAEAFAEVVPDYDRERVRESHIRKLFQWYNILVNAGFDRFEEEKADEAKTEE